MVTLLVGARYGVSQVVNHKLSILTPLTEFSSITRIELLPESDKVSLVKIYLQDIKVGRRTRPRASDSQADAAVTLPHCCADLQTPHLHTQSHYVTLCFPDAVGSQELAGHLGPPEEPLI